MGAVRRQRARAFAPGHVTGVVVADVRSKDPRGRGSRGTGLVLEPGVTATATWTPGAPGGVRLVADVQRRLEISYDVAARLRRSRRGRLEIALRHDLPVGHGFGTSASGALATALACAAVLGEPRSRAIEVAHLAELYGRGGLGGVAAILGGGLEVRVRPGIPPLGRLVRREYVGRVWVGTLGGPIPSPRILADPDAVGGFARAADLVDRVAADPEASTFWEVAEAFTEQAGLCPRPLSRALRAMRRRGARAAQAMFGNSFVAAPPSGARGAAFALWLAAQPWRSVSTSIRAPRALPVARRLGG